MFFSRSRARTKRLLAADSLMRNTCAISLLLSCSKCRSASTSRSRGSMQFKAS
jgi:hypothetical protein